MPSVLYVLHMSDTHVAFAGDDLKYQLARRAPAALGPFAGVADRIRRTIIHQNGAEAAEPWLWHEMLGELARLDAAIGAERDSELLVVHSGDVTQGGQLGSLRRALDELHRATTAEVRAIAGNHDLWPCDFPPFAASRTVLQWRRIRETPGLPAQFPEVWSSTCGHVEIIALDSVLCDSFLNSVALGRIEDEHAGAGAVPRSQLGGWGDPPPRLRAVVMHHPVADSGPKSRWRTFLQHVNMQLGMVLLDAPRIRRELVGNAVSMVLCGHEHQRPPDVSSALLENGRLLLLQAGCPTLMPGFGNDDAPQFALYRVTPDRDGHMELTWYLCFLDPVRWTEFGRLVHDGARWSIAQARGLPSFLSGHKPKPPFP